MGEAWSEEAVEEQGGISMDQLSQYHYFDVDAIIESKKVSKKNLKLGTDIPERILQPVCIRWH